MLIVVKEVTFDSAHYLPGYVGPCGKLHGHTYRLQVGIRGTINPKTGMIMDFKDLGKMIDDVVRIMDHDNLNLISINKFPDQMPTAENIVLWIRDQIRLSITVWNCCRVLEAKLAFVRLWETPTCLAEWRE